MEKEIRSVKNRTKTLFAMIICALGFIILQLAVMLSSVIGHPEFNGALMACQFGLCLVMVKVDYKKGFITAIILNAIALSILLYKIIANHIMTAVPGAFNTIIYIVSLTLLTHQFKIRDKEAVTDMLTGLYNRRGLYKLLQRKIEDKKPFDVIYVDLGNFKIINDNYGHAYGDSLMKLVADRIAEVVGRKGIITRIGGDEFVIILDKVKKTEKVASEILEKIREKAEGYVNDSKIECYLTAYAGISSYPNDTDDFESLIKYADIAMYEAVKIKSKDAFFFTKDMENESKRQIELEKIIKESIEKDFFYLVYQPQFELEGKRLRGFEALLRIRMPNGELVSPGEFIPVAEKSDLILAIDNYVLRRGLREIKEMTEVGGDKLVVSINVSAKNIANIDFADRVLEMIDEVGIAKSSLEIEITEYCLVQSVDVTIENIKKLRSNGVKVALDDFGTGYTSLSYLFKMPIDLVKIDKSLIDEIEASDRNRDFVNAVIDMGHMMGCEVISEGVEKESQVEMLKSQKCDLVQGYVWGKPMAYEAAKQLAIDEKQG